MYRYAILVLVVLAALGAAAAMSKKPLEQGMEYVDNPYIPDEPSGTTNTTTATTETGETVTVVPEKLVKEVMRGNLLVEVVLPDGSVLSESYTAPLGALVAKWRGVMKIDSLRISIYDTVVPLIDSAKDVHVHYTVAFVPSSEGSVERTYEIVSRSLYIPIDEVKTWGRIADTGYGFDAVVVESHSIDEVNITDALQRLGSTDVRGDGYLLVYAYLCLSASGKDLYCMHTEYPVEIPVTIDEEGGKVSPSPPVQRPSPPPPPPEDEPKPSPPPSPPPNHLRPTDYSYTIYYKYYWVCGGGPYSGVRAHAVLTVWAVRSDGVKVASGLSHSSNAEELENAIRVHLCYDVYTHEYELTDGPCVAPFEIELASKTIPIPQPPPEYDQFCQCKAECLKHTSDAGYCIQYCGGYPEGFMDSYGPYDP